MAKEGVGSIGWLLMFAKSRDVSVKCSGNPCHSARSLMRCIIGSHFALRAHLQMFMTNVHLKELTCPTCSFEWIYIIWYCNTLNWNVFLSCLGKLPWAILSILYTLLYDGNGPGKLPALNALHCNLRCKFKLCNAFAIIPHENVHMCALKKTR